MLARAVAMDTDEKGAAAAAGKDKEDGDAKQPDGAPDAAAGTGPADGVPGGAEGGDKKGTPPAAPEPGSFTLENPCRVTPAQRKFIGFEEGSRWRPVAAARPASGILVLKDLRPGRVLSAHHVLYPKPVHPMFRGCAPKTPSGP